jgi:hypothetical protein
MPILVMCVNPECGEIIHAPDSAAGKKGRCPFCGMVQDIPAAPEGTQDALHEEDASEEEMVVLKDSGWIDSAVRAEQEEEPPTPDEPWDRIVAPDPKNPSSADTAMEEEPSSPLDLLTEAEEQRIASEELKRKEALGDNTGVLAVFFMGFVGLLLGAALGGAALSPRLVLGIYLGGVCGWVIGFILGFVAVIALDRSMELDLHRGPSQDDFMVRDCLRAYSYRSSGFAGLFVLILVSAVVHTLARAAWLIFLRFPDWPPEARWSVLVGGILLEILYVGYALRVGLNLVAETFEGRASAPGIPRPNPLVLLATAAQGVGLLALYVLPLITLPLLPLGLLGLSYSGGIGAYNLLWARRAGIRWSAVLLTLWLLLLVWAAVLAALVALIVLVGNELSGMVPELPGYQGLIIDLLVFGIRATFLSIAGVVLGCILFHCVGIFGRHNPVVLRHLPKRITPASAVFLLVGLTLLALIVYRVTRA